MNERLRHAILEGKAAYGMWVTLPNATITEIAAELGLDWICVDLEHGSLSLSDVVGHARVAHGSEMSCLVRVPTVRSELIRRLLDSGADGILFPLVRSAQELHEAIELCLLPPEGRRGIGGERAVRWGLRLRGYLEAANREVMLVPMIETVQAVEGIDEILAVPHVDAVFFGPADLSASAGYAGYWEGPGVADMIADVRARAAAKSIGTGIVALDIGDAEERQRQGFSLLALGSDAGLIIRTATSMLQRLKGEAPSHHWF